MKVIWNSLIRGLSSKSTEIVAASSSASTLDKTRQVTQSDADSSMQVNPTNIVSEKPLDARTSEVAQGAKIGGTDLAKAMNELIQAIRRTNEESLRAIAANIR